MEILNKQINEKVKCSIDRLRDLKEDRKSRSEEAKELIDFISSSLGISKTLAQTLADYQISYSGGQWMIILDFKGDRLWEWYGRINETKAKYKALEIIFSRITAKK